jgi:hypothetical protein
MVVASFGVWDAPWLWLWPTKGALLLFQAGFAPLGAGGWAYALGSSAPWIALLAVSGAPCVLALHRARRGGALMRAGQVVRALGPVDLRSIRRDSLLAWMTAMPLALGLLLVFQTNSRSAQLAR